MIMMMRRWWLWLLVLVVVDVVHECHEFRNGRVEFDLRELLLLDAQDAHAERQHALDVRVVVRDVKGGPGHVGFDKGVRAGQEVAGRRFAQVLPSSLLQFLLLLLCRVAGVVAPR